MNATKKAFNVNIVVLIMFLVLSALSLLPKSLLSDYKILRNYILIFINVLIYVIPIIILKKMSATKHKKFLSRKPLRLRMMPVTIAAALAASLGGMFFNFILIEITGYKNLPEILNPISNIMSEDMLTTFLLVIFLPSVLEELFFRGAYLNSFIGHTKINIIVCAVLFAVMHANIYNFFGPLLAGFVYCFLVKIFDSVYPAIVAHIINNTFSLLLLYYLPNIKAAGLDTFIVVVFIILFFLLCYLTIIFSEPYLNKIKDPEKLNISERVEKQNKSSHPVNVPFYIICGLYAVKVAVDFII